MNDREKGARDLDKGSFMEDEKCKRKKVRARGLTLPLRNTWRLSSRNGEARKEKGEWGGGKSSACSGSRQAAMQPSTAGNLGTDLAM